MERSLESGPPTYTRRAVLTVAAGFGAATVLGAFGARAKAATSSPSATLQVDFATTAYFPLLKSKIGVARALAITEILDSLQYLDEIRPALYNGELRFPDTDWPSLTPYPFEVAADGTVTVQSNTFLNELFAGLQQRNIEIVVQLEGAPKQWWDYQEAQAPENFPIPTNLSASANAIGEWAKLYKRYPISWSIWNEPSHNLTGSPDLTSIQQMVEIYDAYTGAIAPQGLFGMADFIPANAVASSELNGQTYVGATINELRQQLTANPGLPFDYLSMNNYGKPVDSIVDGSRNALGTDFNTVPLMQMQFGVFQPGVWDTTVGTVLEAALSMAALDQALQIPDLQVLTFSGWIPHFITYSSGGTAVQTPLFSAFKLYARMPDRRATVQGSLPSGVGAMASSDEYRSAVMVWNETDSPQTVTLQLSDVPNSRMSGAVLNVYYIDSNHGSPVTPSQTINYGQPPKSLSETVTVEGPGVAYLEISTASSDPVLDRSGLSATLVRKHTYADRTTNSDGTISVRGNAYGCYDTVRAIAYLGIEGDEGTALCAAEYSRLPGSLAVNIWSDLPTNQANSSEALFGIRVDYILASGPAKSVLWHGDIFDDHRTTPLPWGLGGPTADVLLDAPALDRAPTGQADVDLALAANAPSGWAKAGSQAIISFWMDSTGPGSQARFLLGPGQGSDSQGSDSQGG